MFQLKENHNLLSQWGFFPYSLLNFQGAEESVFVKKIWRSYIFFPFSVLSYGFGVFVLFGKNQDDVFRSRGGRKLP